MAYGHTLHGLLAYVPYHGPKEVTTVVSMISLSLSFCLLCVCVCREVVVMRDGGHVCLDWYNNYHTSQPTVIILPGLAGKVWSKHTQSTFLTPYTYACAGSSDDNYVQHWVDDVCKQTYRLVVAVVVTDKHTAQRLVCSVASNNNIKRNVLTI